jgi:hypothetical protein
MVLAGGVAAAGGILLGWQVPAPSPQALKAMLTPAPAKTAAASERAAPLPTPAPAAEARPAPAPSAGEPADKSEPRSDARAEPSGADSDRWVFRFVTPGTKVTIDPTRGKASLETPVGSIKLDTDKREARMDAPQLFLGLLW